MKGVLIILLSLFAACNNTVIGQDANGLLQSTLDSLLADLKNIKPLFVKDTSIVQDKNYVNIAKNKTVNGLKEGIWLEYDSVISTDWNSRDTLGFRITLYTAGKPFGIVKDFDRDGRLSRETPYLNGKKNGVEKLYWINGKVIDEIPYINDTANGISKIYVAESGKLDRIVPLKNGKIDGVVKWYDYYGKLEREEPYTNGLENGIYKHYNSYGVVDYTEVWINGVMQK